MAGPEVKLNWLTVVLNILAYSSLSFFHTKWERMPLKTAGCVLNCQNTTKNEKMASGVASIPPVISLLLPQILAPRLKWSVTMYFVSCGYKSNVVTSLGQGQKRCSNDVPALTYYYIPSESLRAQRHTCRWWIWMKIKSFSKLYLLMLCAEIIGSKSRF